MQYFHDSKLQAEFDRNGYLLVDLCSLQTIEALTDFYYQNTPQVLPGFSTTGHANEIEYRQKASEFVHKMFMPEVNRFLIDFKSLICSYINKQAHSESPIAPHQDWSFVDENDFISLGVWCPLVDTNEENGQLYVVPGTHKLPKFPRTAPCSYYPYADAVALIQQQAIPVPTRRGQAIIYDNSLIHASPSNQSDTNRLVAGMLVIPQAAQPILYYSDAFSSPGTAQMYHVAADHFIKNQVLARPSNDYFVKDVEVAAQLNVEYDLKQAFLQSPKKDNFWSKLWAKFA